MNFFQHKDVEFKVFLPVGQVFNKVKYSVVSGNATIDTLSANTIKVKSTNGNIELIKLTAEELNITSVNGALTLDRAKSKNLKVTFINGRSQIMNSQITEDIKLSNVNGSVMIRDSEGNHAKISTVNGHVKGHEFYLKTTSVSTVSGDIIITNEDLSRPIQVKSQKTATGHVTIS